MEMRQLEMLRAVVEATTYLGAGESMHISHTAIHRQIRLLEMELGHKLLVRSGTAMHLTDAGRILLGLAEKVKQDVQSLKQAINDLQGLTGGELRVGTGSSVLILFLPPALEEFHDRYPGVRLRIITGTAEQIVDGLRRGTLDVGLIREPSEDWPASKDLSGNYTLDESRVWGDDRQVRPWMPKGFEFLSGLPESKRRRRNFVVIQAYVDESGGKGQSSVFVFSALLASANDWAQFSNEWQAHLDAPPKIDYFKMNQAATLSGEFGNFSPKRRDDKIKALIPAMRGLMEVFCIADMKGFSETIAVRSTGVLRSPYVQQFNILIMAIGYALLDLGIKEPFEIFFDEHVIFGPRAKAWYPILRELCDDDIKAILPIEPFFRSDRDFLPLQGADMIAWMRRRYNDSGLGEFAWLEYEISNKLLASGHSQYLDRKRMEDIINLSYTPEYAQRANDLLARYRAVEDRDWNPLPGKRLKNNERPDENEEYETFNSAMDTLLKADPKSVKAAMEADKQLRALEAERTGKRGRGRPTKRPSAASRASSGKD